MNSALDQFSFNKYFELSYARVAYSPRHVIFLKSPLLDTLNERLLLIESNKLTCNKLTYPSSWSLRCSYLDEAAGGLGRVRLVT